VHMQVMCHPQHWLELCQMSNAPAQFVATSARVSSGACASHGPPSVMAPVVPCALAARVVHGTCRPMSQASHKKHALPLSLPHARTCSQSLHLCAREGTTCAQSL
jgi:hypothetical protein